MRTAGCPIPFILDIDSAVYRRDWNTLNLIGDVKHELCWECDELRPGVFICPMEMYCHWNLIDRNGCCCCCCWCRSIGPAPDLPRTCPGRGLSTLLTNNCQSHRKCKTWTLLSISPATSHRLLNPAKDILSTRYDRYQSQLNDSARYFHGA